MNAAPASPTRPRGPGRVQFLLLAVLFFTPFVSAWLLYFYLPEHRPTGTTNYGQLVTPLQELPKWALVKPDGGATTFEEQRGKWLLVQLAPADCDDKCMERVLLTRQVRTALDGERARVQRLLLVRDAATLAALEPRLAAEHPDLILRALEDAAAVDFGFFGKPQPGALYLVDPIGNYLMVYPDRGNQEDFKGLQKDLKKLLKLSQLG